MIDVIFLLLIFFMTTTTLSKPESQLRPGLQAQRAGGRAADLEPQIVDVKLIGGEPAFQLGERVARRQAALVAMLEALPKEQGVFIRVWDDVNVAWATSAMQAARDAGFTKVNYVPAE